MYWIVYNSQSFQIYFYETLFFFGIKKKQISPFSKKPTRKLIGSRVRRKRSKNNDGNKRFRVIHCETWRDAARCVSHMPKDPEGLRVDIPRAPFDTCGPLRKLSSTPPKPRSRASVKKSRVIVYRSIYWICNKRTRAWKALDFNPHPWTAIFVL